LGWKSRGRQGGEWKSKLLPDLWKCRVLSCCLDQGTVVLWVCHIWLWIICGCTASCRWIQLERWVCVWNCVQLQFWVSKVADWSVWPSILYKPSSSWCVPGSVQDGGRSGQNHCHFIPWRTWFLWNGMTLFGFWFCYPSMYSMPVFQKRHVTWTPFFIDSSKCKCVRAEMLLVHSNSKSTFDVSKCRNTWVWKLPNFIYCVRRRFHSHNSGNLLLGSLNTCILLLWEAWKIASICWRTLNTLYLKVPRWAMAVHVHSSYSLPIYKNKQTLWPESASKLYRLSDRHLLVKLVPTFADRGCHMVNMTDPSAF
jgi:hypothetical protein